MTKLPKAISERVLEIMGVKLRVYQLDDGQCVFDSDDVHALFASWDMPGAEQPSKETMLKLVQATNGVH